ncbi:MAG: ribosomal protein [Verrucomicrobiota bacterium]|jgi:large subunit ribosomal protein L4
MDGVYLTVEKAKALGLDVVTDGRYTQVLHDVVVAYQAARRSGSANTKTKAEVNLSGAKPWRQKGTGRARAGYKSSPVWVGGGVVFGPKPRDYSKSVTKAEKRLALRKAVSLKVISSQVLSLSSIDAETPKTKAFLAKLPADVSGQSVLVVSSGFSDNTYLAARNVQCISLKSAAEVNAEDIMRSKLIILSESGMSELLKRTN